METLDNRRTETRQESAGCSAAMTREEKKALLREIRVTRRDDSYTKYGGQMVRFTLTLTNGSTTAVTAYNPFLNLDGQGWRTAYEPCEALNAFGNRLNQ